RAKACVIRMHGRPAIRECRATPSPTKIRLLQEGRCRSTEVGALITFFYDVLITDRRWMWCDLIELSGNRSMASGQVITLGSSLSLPTTPWTRALSAARDDQGHQRITSRRSR